MNFKIPEPWHTPYLWFSIGSTVLWLAWVTYRFSRRFKRPCRGCGSVWWVRRKHVLIENTDPLLSGRNWFSYTFTDCRCGHAHLVKSEDKEFDFIEYYSRRLFCPGQFKIAYELFSRAKVMLPSGGRLMIVGKLRKVSTQSIPALVGK